MITSKMYCGPCKHYEVCKFREKVEDIERSNLPAWNGTSSLPITLQVNCKFMDREDDK